MELLPTGMVLAMGVLTLLILGKYPDNEDGNFAK